MSYVAAVQIAFDDGPLATSPTWTTITDATDISIQRGRANSYDRVQAGRCTITLSDRLRTYDPTNSASALFGDGTRMRPGRQIRVLIFGTDWYLFTGHIVSWSLPFSGTDTPVPSVRIEAVDRFGYLGTRYINGSYPSDGISTILYFIWFYLDLPLAWFSYGSDTTQIAAQTYVNANALEAMQTLAASGRGTLYVKRDGAVIYVSSGYRENAVLATSAIFGGAGYPYLSADLAYDRNEIYNEARITGNSGAAQVVTDAASANDYFYCPFPPATLPLLNDSDALALAQTIVNRYRSPRARINTLRCVQSAYSDADWSYIAGVYDINHRIRATVAPPVGTAFTSDYFIEGVQHRINGQRWEVSYTLSPAAFYTVWKLGDAVDGVLSTTTSLA